MHGGNGGNDGKRGLNIYRIERDLYTSLLIYLFMKKGRWWAEVGTSDGASRIKPQRQGAVTGCEREWGIVARVEGIAVVKLQPLVKLHPCCPAVWLCVA
jgi:hypothetical protein